MSAKLFFFLPSGIFGEKINVIWLTTIFTFPPSELLDFNVNFMAILILIVQGIMIQQCIVMSKFTALCYVPLIFSTPNTTMYRFYQQKWVIFEIYLYWHRLFLPIPDYTDCPNNRPDYAYGRLIGTALRYKHKCCRGLWITLATRPQLKISLFPLTLPNNLKLGR